MSRFLRFCAFLSVLFFTGNLMAAGYTCSTTATYTSCKEGYYLEACGTEESDWSGQTATPVAGKTCLTCPDGYECSGGQDCPLRKGIHCIPGTYVKAGTTACMPCPAGKYCSGFDTDDKTATETDRGITGTCPEGKYCPTGTGTPEACPAYYRKSAAGSDAESDCYTSCALGAVVTAPGTACTTPAGAWYSTAEHFVYYGKISPIGFCPYGSDSRNGVPSLHDQGADCLVTVPAGYSSAITTSAARYIRISSETGVFPLAEIQAYNSSTQMSLAVGSSMINGASALDGSLATQAIVSTGSAVGPYAIFDLGSAKTITNIKFALGNVTSGYKIVIAISSDKSNWTTVFDQTIYGVSALPGVLQNVPVRGRTNTKCAAGTYHGETTVPATNGVTCTACPTAADHKMTSYSNLTDAAYVYSSENLTFESIQLLGWDSLKGGTSIESCAVSYSYNNSRGYFTIEAVRYNSSTEKYDKGGNLFYTRPNAGYYLTTRYSDTYCSGGGTHMLYQDAQLCPAGSYCGGRTSLTACSSGTYGDTLGIDGSVSVGYYSTGGGTSATPTAAGNGCVSGQKCGPLAAGYFSVQPGMTTATPTYMSQKCTLTTIDGVANSMGCGFVEAGYYSTGGGTHPRPTATGNGCVAGQKCGTIAAGYYSAGGARSETGTGAVNAGYYSTGGATSPNPEPNADCVGGNSCGLLSGGYFSTGGATKATPTSADCVGAVGSDIWSSSDSPAKNVCGQLLPGYYSTEGGILPVPGELGAKNTAALGFNIDYLNQGLDSVRAGCLGGSTECGMVSAGYFSSGAATSPIPSSADCVSGTCGICPAGAYSAAGATSCTACPALTSGWEYVPLEGGTSYASCKQYTTPDGCAAGKVAVRAASATAWRPLTAAEPYSWATSGSVLTAKPGYYRISGTAVTCTICPAGTYSTGGEVSSCTKIKAGYFSSGAATSPTPSSKSCVSGTCGICPAGSYSAAGATSCTSCPALGGSNWAWDMSQGAESYSECKRTGVPDGCIAGTVTDTASSATTWGNRVLTEWAAPGNTKLLAKAGYKPNTSKLECTLCPNGYYSTDYTAFSCDYVDAGYYATGAATSPTPSSSDCVTGTCGLIDAGYWGAAGATTSTGSGKVNAGYYATGAATSPTPSSSDCVTGTCGLIDAGYWGAAGATTSTGSGTVNAGYYATGGGTSATPTASGNGCVSGKECGTIDAGYWSDGGAKTATPASTSDCVNGKCGLIHIGFYSTGGGTHPRPYPDSNQGVACLEGFECGYVAAGYYSNGGGTSATPTEFGDGCVGQWNNNGTMTNHICGKVNAGYYSTGGAITPTPTASDCHGYDITDETDVKANRCGVVDAGYYATGGATSAQGHGIIKLGLYSTCGATSEGGSNLAASDYLECADGCECGRVAAGYFANGGGTSATPTAAGNGCLSGQSCGTMAAGYYSRGGAGSANASGYYCWGYNEYSDGVAGCGLVGAGYWNNGGGTDVNGTCVSGKSCGLIDAGYYGNAGATTSTGAGEVNGGFFSTGGGKTATPASNSDCAGDGTTCGKIAAGYWSYRGGKTATPTSSADCTMGYCGVIRGGYYSTCGGIEEYATAGSVNSCADGCECGPINPGYYSTGCSISDDGAVCDTSKYTVGEIVAGYYSDGGSNTPQGDGLLAAGYFSTGGATVRKPTSADCVGSNTCGTVNAGYYVSGGGTLAAPVAFGNGCVGQWKNNAGEMVNHACGKVGAGYWNNGGGTDVNGTCVSGKSCGLIDAGYYGNAGATTSTGTGTVWPGHFSTGGATKQKPTAADCVGDNECGLVDAGYWTSWGGRTKTPANAETDCVNKDCGVLGAGYYSTGGATRSNPTEVGNHCFGTSCGLLGAGYYSSGGGTSATPTAAGNGCLEGFVCGGCPTGYDDNTDQGKTAVNQCQISCAAGTRVAARNAACTSPAGGWFSAATLTSYGNVSPVSYCMDGYTSTSTSASGHDAATDCVQTIAGGKYVPSSKINARYVKMTGNIKNSVNNYGVHVVEMQAFASNDGTGTNLMADSTSDKTTDDDWTTNSHVGISTAKTWDLGSVQSLGSLKFALYPGRTYYNVAIYVSEDNTNWTTVFGPQDVLTQSISPLVGEVVVLSAAPKSCAAGTYKASGSLALTNTSSCDAAQAGYFVGATGASSQTKCVMGSYTDTTGQSECKACAAGKTNSADGATSCTADCSNAAGVASTGWETPVWGTDNKMTNLCTIKATAGCSAKYYKDSNACLMCPDGYQDGGAGYTQISQCTMNVAGGKYVAEANESSASGTCGLGTYKPAHPVTYGKTSSCIPCPNATYADQEGMSACEACPTATKYADNVVSYGSDKKARSACYARFEDTVKNGETTYFSCYLRSGDDYGTLTSGKNCWTHGARTKCDAGYYSSVVPNANYDEMWYMNYSAVVNNLCTPVESGYWSGADSLTRTACETGLVTCGAGLCANEPGDCGRKLHAGDNVIYLRSEKRTTPSLNVKVGDKVFYGNLGDVIANSLRVKNGTKNYSVVNDNQ